MASVASETEEEGIERWFRSYLAAFSALARGDSDDVRGLLGYYAVPLLVSSDGRCVVLNDEAAVLGNVQRSIDALRPVDFDRTDLVGSDTTIVNRGSAFHHARVSRRLRDGSEIEQIESTFLIADTPVGRRIAAIVVHSPR